MRAKSAAFRAREDRLALWFACALLAGAGWYFAVFRLNAAIDRQHALTANIASIAHADARLVAARPQLERSQAQLEAAIDALDLRADRAAIVARFIGELTRIGALRSVTIAAIDERSAAATATGAASPRFETLPLDVTLTGTYRNVVAAIGDLARARVALRIELASLERGTDTDGSFGTAQLTAHLHVGVQRLVGAPQAPL